MSKLKEILEEYPNAIKQLRKEYTSIGYEPVKMIFFLNGINKPEKIYTHSMMQELENELRKESNLLKPIENVAIQ
jgi:hypothetical protein